MIDNKYVQKKDCTIRIIDETEYPICPKCKDHKHYRDEEGRNDCKTIIHKDKLTKDGKLEVYAQCCCYSKEHR